MKKLSIQDLLEKYLKGNLSSEELDFLFHSINQNMHEDEVTAWFYKHWDETSGTGNRKSTIEALKKIKQDLGMPSSSFKATPASLIYRLTDKKVLYNIMKLAALFIVGFFMAFLLLNKNKPDTLLQDISMNEISIPLGAKSKLVLSDGTQVWLNAGSTLKYPGQFGDSARKIYLEGEAFFDVAHDKKRPFYVVTSDINIKVLGTQFNVKSYPEENVIEATLVSGSIEIETRPENKLNIQHIKIKPNQKATFIRETQKLSLLDSSPAAGLRTIAAGTFNIQERINTEIVTSWKDDKLIFTRERFEDILIKMERWYDVDIILEDPSLKDIRYTGTFEKESVEQALDALRLATPFKYQITKNNIILYTQN